MLLYQYVGTILLCIIAIYNDTALDDTVSVCGLSSLMLPYTLVESKITLHTAPESVACPSTAPDSAAGLPTAPVSGLPAAPDSGAGLSTAPVSELPTAPVNAAGLPTAPVSTAGLPAATVSAAGLSTATDIAAGLSTSPDSATGLSTALNDAAGIIQCKHTLTAEDAFDVYEMMFDAREKWRFIGGFLRVSQSTLNNIDAENKTNEDKLYKVIIEWLNKYGNTPRCTLSHIALALRNKTVGREDLAQEVCEKYPLPLSVPPALHTASTSSDPQHEAVAAVGMKPSTSPSGG